jgi:hypothetical protein
MNILAPCLEFIFIPDAVIRKSTLPDWELRTHSMREAPFDESHNLLDRGTLRSEQEMNVVRHDDKSVELIVALSAVFLQYLQK